MHINEFPGAGESSAYLAKYDSIHGQWPHECVFENGAIVVDGKPISYSTHDTPARFRGTSTASNSSSSAPANS